MSEVVHVVCPWCWQGQDLVLELDATGDWAEDCQVCCQPWQVRSRRVGEELEIEVEREE